MCLFVAFVAQVCGAERAVYTERERGIGRMGETKYRDAGDILIKIIKLKYVDVEFFIQT